ncbi:MAG: formylglycine-generating enzyme family protein, partial [bacterium]|nr:formylglycine-generating enzyme family protein [bacterium]
VGFKAPNALGIYDMSGSVCEYVWEWYRGCDGDTGAHPHGANICDKRIHRGGSWVDLVSSGYFRTSNRNSGDTDILAVNLGLRLARNR